MLDYISYIPHPVVSTLNTDRVLIRPDVCKPISGFSPCGNVGNTVPTELATIGASLPNLPLDKRLDKG